MLPPTDQRTLKNVIAVSTEDKRAQRQVYRRIGGDADIESDTVFRVSVPFRSRCSGGETDLSPAICR